MIIRIHYGCYNDKDNVEVDNAASMTAQIKAAGAQHTLWGTEQRYARYFSERDTDHIYIYIVYIYIYIHIFWKNRMRENIGSIVKGRIAAGAAAAAALKLTERKTWKIKLQRCRKMAKSNRGAIAAVH